MPRPRLAVPSYRHHRPSGQAVVTVRRPDDTPADVYLGPYGSDESRAAYARLVAELRASGPPTVRTAGPVLTVGDLIIRFMRHAPTYYRHLDGRPTSEVKEFKYALTPLSDLYPDLPVAEFGPRALKAYRQKLIDAGLCRKRVNKHVGRVRRMFAWGVEEQAVAESVYASLLLVKGLRKGRSAARETEDVGPVDRATVEKTLLRLTPTVRAMVELQWATGMRPEEVRYLTAGEIDRSGPVWVYRPRSHKTAYRGRVRSVWLGPRAQAVLAPLLDAGPDPDEPLFSPVRAREERYAMRRAARTSKVTPSQLCRRLPAQQLQKRPRDRFSDHGYGQCVRKAAAAAGAVHWHPNQLRHAFATEVRRRYGLEAAQVLLGHAKADVTQVYAARDVALAARVAAELG